MRSPERCWRYCCWSYLSVVRFPWESPEEFFTRCMADNGIEVVNVEVQFFGSSADDGMSVRFTPADVNAGGRDAAFQACTDELLRLYSSNTTTTRPE